MSCFNANNGKHTLKRQFFFPGFYFLNIKMKSRVIPSNVPSQGSVGLPETNTLFRLNKMSIYFKFKFKFVHVSIKLWYHTSLTSRNYTKCKETKYRKMHLLLNLRIMSFNVLLPLHSSDMFQSCCLQDQKRNCFKLN